MPHSSNVFHSIFVLGGFVRARFTRLIGRTTADRSGRRPNILADWRLIMEGSVQLSYKTSRSMSQYVKVKGVGLTRMREGRNTKKADGGA
jgi:hypothetical protein